MHNNLMVGAEPSPDEQTLGRYQLLMNLGTGGMGAIHLAVAKGTGEFKKLVVIKELRRDLASNTRFVELFMHEARLAGRLNHVNIVQTLEAAQVDDRYFMSMEFLDGQPLSALMEAVADFPAPPPRVLVHVICNMLAGLHYAHELCDYGGQSLQIVHCDVNNHNVFVTYDGHVKVVDFGIAKATGATHHNDTFHGRLAYASPEQIRGDALDRRADIFSAGVMLWEALTGKRFVSDGMDDQSIVNARLLGTETNIEDAIVGIDPVLARICNKALQRDPNNRFATAEEFRIALVNYGASRWRPVDPKVVSEFMSTRFAEERSLRNLMIHQALKNEHSSVKIALNRKPSSTTIPGRRPITLPPPDHHAATKVADLSELVERSRVTYAGGSPDNGQFRSTTRKFLLPGLAAIGVVAALATMGLKGSSDPEAAKADAETLAPPPLDTQSSKGDLTPPPADSAQAVEAGQTADAEAPDAQDADAEEVDEKSNSKPRRRTRRVVRGTPRPSADKNVVVEPEEAEGIEAVAVEPETPVAAPVRVAPKTSPTVKPTPSAGEDLSTRRKRKQRSLDVDNPFQ